MVPRLLSIGGTQVEVWTDHVKTILPDGAVVYGAPQDSDAYRATAERLGYGADTTLLCLEHEVAHTLVGAIVGLPESLVLAATAHARGDSVLTGLEEDAVLALQRLARALGVSLIDVAARWSR